LGPDPIEFLGLLVLYLSAVEPFFSPYSFPFRSVNFHYPQVKAYTNRFVRSSKKTKKFVFLKKFFLPEDTPMDLFSGKDFKYEKTKEGFVLRCQGKDLVKNKIYEYEFKVKK